jgi:hypothetical protein
MMSQTQEIQHNVRRLSHHPSIIVWDGCNECGGQGIYNDFVVTTVAKEDKSRAVWPSCPACGYVSGVDMLYGLPNGKPLKPRPVRASYLTAPTPTSSFVFAPGVQVLLFLLFSFHIFLLFALLVLPSFLLFTSS